MIRRDWIKKSALLAGMPALSFGNLEFPQKFDGKVILFQGDSITDGGREKENQMANHPNSLGYGYVKLLSADLLKNHPEKQLRIYNRGISGNKVFQLEERWQMDAIDLQPDLLSILIGVNDFWHTFNGYKGTTETYLSDFRKLVEQTLEKLPDVKIMICEPFVVKGGTAINEEWFPTFNEYQEASKVIATEFKTVFVPYQRYFDKALEKAPASYWAPDGVHPSLAGCELMAEAWMESFKII